MVANSQSELATISFALLREQIALSLLSALLHTSFHWVRALPPLLAITMGDPGGIGPETIAGAWPCAAVHECCRPLVVGHPEIMRRAVRLLNGSARVMEITSPDDAEPSPEAMPCLSCGSDEALAALAGAIDRRGGQAAYESVMLAADLALSGRVDGMVTAPLNKAALWAAGHKYPGHTELLAERCGVQDFAMMLYLRGWHALSTDAKGVESAAGTRSPEHAGLGVVHVTLHMALRDVFANLSTPAVLTKCRLADGVMRLINGRQPRIGVCAVNPHAGEQGLFGDEEQRIIAPAVEQARAAGLDVTGPLPADTLMVKARDGAFDAVVAMYHDQGHIALKLLGMHRAVNVTLGLPIVRTSAAHGTAFDIAWQGRADCGGMVEAVRVAAKLAAAHTNPTRQRG
jgi:4-hydroxythreonine-4-phosphate dehydrogenase